jgi:thioredoxin 2
MIRECPSCGARNRVSAARLDEQATCGKCKTPIPPFDKPVSVGSAEEFDELVKSSPLPVLVDFWAAWCGPCRMVAPELEKIARSKAGRVLIAKVDTDGVPDVAQRFNIRSIPTLILFRDGREAQRVSGAMPAAAIESSFALA